MMATFIFTRPSLATTCNKQNGNREKSLGQTQLLQILSKGRNVSLTPAQAVFFASNCFKLRHKILNAAI
jgi:hypothetical protein